ncbi:molybdenum cofactor cytidylyltransferase [Monaibacterium marinum]|uniref:Molybdenum cofactor cytidylyltransferase n=1 Tax=Pontivivens marinum TaxID=1690039 RepID=A0A2C9CQ39_9RHOB|nr:nucleotidyltransferase family protein [Monaibacterium marinum]SOH93340.1 molybdenum cofactor cytidylyltransferase [Monaibacterium marinum]
MPQMHRVATIILAAGLSRRMGAHNKLLLPVNGLPMVRHVVQQYRAALDGPIIVVTGWDACAVKQALLGLGAQCVFNPSYEQGQQSSVAFGLSNCPPADVVLIGLGDQPLLRSADITALLEAHVSGHPAKISIPTSDGKRGNPIAVPHVVRPQLTMDRLRPGCMRFTRDNPDMVQRHSLSAQGFYTDVDTPEAYASLTAISECAS